VRPRILADTRRRPGLERGGGKKRPRARRLRRRRAAAMARLAELGTPLRRLVAERDALAERLASSPMGDLTLTPDGHILDANARTAQLFGRRP
jgi:PAS domain-containing protein